MNFDVTLDAGRPQGHARASTTSRITSRTRPSAEAETNISATLGEFMGEDPEDSRDWDTKGLAVWAMSRFHVNLSQSQIAQDDAARGGRPLKRSGASSRSTSATVPGWPKYLEPDYALKRAVRLGGGEVRHRRATGGMLQEPNRAHRAEAGGGDRRADRGACPRGVRPREIEYPVDHALTFAFGDGADTENPYAAWITSAPGRMAKYGVELPLEHIRSMSLRQAARRADRLAGAVHARRQARRARSIG